MLSKKLMRKRASLRDLYRLYQVVSNVPKALRLLKDIGSTTIDSVLLNPIKDSLSVRRARRLHTFAFTLI